MNRRSAVACIAVIATLLLATDSPGRERTVTPRQFTKQVGFALMTGEDDLRRVCETTPFAELRTLTLVKSTLARKDVARLRATARRAVQDLIGEQDRFFWDSVRRLPALASMKTIRVDVSPATEIAAEADPERRSIVMTTGLMLYDFVETLGTPAALCTAAFPSRYPVIGAKPVSAEELNTVSAKLHFVVRFQLLHEIGHVLLGHTGENQPCEELEADRFAVDYLHSVGDVLFLFPKPNLPLNSVWPGPATPQEPLLRTHPDRRIREDRVETSMAFRAIAFQSLVPRSRLDIPGAIIGTTMMDADRYQALDGLERALRRGTSCHAH
jgi:hypothetical protein